MHIRIVFLICELKFWSIHIRIVSQERACAFNPLLFFFIVVTLYSNQHQERRSTRCCSLHGGLWLCCG